MYELPNNHQSAQRLINDIEENTLGHWQHDGYIILRGLHFAPACKAGVREDYLG
jgi:hypothetical protein